MTGLLRLTRDAAIAATLVVTLGAAGCSDDKNEGASTTTVTRFPPTVPVQNEDIVEGDGACGLLTQAEVATAVGSAVNPGTGTRTKTNESCRWTLRTGANQFVAVILSPAGKAQYDQAAEALGSSAEQLPGIGDRAFVAHDTAYALQGERLIIVQVATSQAVPARKDAATRLVGDAVGRR
ncbi:MAG: hypothetical protein M3144_09730 [Actinomycetota bacterium]|nr:hypothetical protein [Actinomycetota bacterium]